MFIVGNFLEFFSDFILFPRNANEIILIVINFTIGLRYESLIKFFYVNFKLGIISIDRIPRYIFSADFFIIVIKCFFAEYVNSCCNFFINFNVSCWGWLDFDLESSLHSFI